MSKGFKERCLNKTIKRKKHIPRSPVVRIIDFHSIDPGSIPGGGVQVV